MNDIKSRIKYLFFIPAVIFAQNGETEFSSELDSAKSSTAYAEQKVYNIFEYQPTEDITLIYDSNFGETTSRIEITENGFLDINENDDFRYVQEMSSDGDGIYLLKADQEIDLFLFFSKEIETFYPTPALQLPNNFTIGQEWVWEGYKVENDDSIKVRSVGKIMGEDSITVAAGTFNAIRIRFDIETSGGEHSVIDQWMAQNVGRVKMHVVIDGNGFIGTILSLLGYDEIKFDLKAIKNVELANQD